MATKSNTITAMFDKMGKDAIKRKAGDSQSVEDDSEDPSPPKKHRLSIERIYQKKSQLEHILLRPDTYIGSIEKTKEPMWVYDEASETMVSKDITFVPGLYKIFDEILVNAADNKQRDPQGMTTIKISIDPEQNMITIWNNGKGIPVVEHATEKVYVPTLIFGHLLTSSNYNDDEKKVTGGRNGYGAKLCNIFSKKFVVETRCNDFGLSFKQTWTDNMTKAGEPKVVSSKGEDYTSVTFWPDLKKFNMDTLDKDIVDLFNRRAYDMVASTRGVKVYLNGKKLEIKNFKDYVELYTKGKMDDFDQPLKVVYETVNDRWEVGITSSNSGFQQVSFVNSIATTKGGKHVDFVTEKIVSNLIEIIKKKEKKAGIAIKPNQVKTHVWVFINCLIENPTFDSQTKENMTKQAKNFGSTCQLSEKFFNSVAKCGVIDAIQSWMRVKQQEQLTKLSGTKRSKLKGIPKLDDANDAGTKNAIDCTLILTEGDSAKTLAVAGLGVVGRDRYGVFPLKGKVLNVRDALHKQLMDNAEINNLVKIVGLQYKLKYETPESLQTLRYGKIMIMTDQDQDGSHIKGLIINFIHSNWPHLLRHKFLEEFITPIVKVSKKHQEKSFYSLPEFEEWKSATENWHTWKVKYYKGLGTSTAKEAKEYFRDMARHRIPFKYAGPEDDAAILLAFSKQKVQERKEWLTNWMEEKKRRAEIGLQEAYLYGKDTRFISYNEFVNKELILYSNMDNERSIPSMMDGFKPGQRKVVFTCLKRNLVKEIKVAQLAGSVAELSAYHHGENSLMATIIGLAQNFVGSNNLNLLLPIGQFGTRLNGGKDCASPRYIFTALSSLTRHVFNAGDDPLLRCMTDDNLKIEPEWYVPIIPMVLVNGAEGIGTGWSTKIPNYDVREIVNNIKMMLDGREPLPMIPSFKHFKGEIEMIDNTKCVSNGEISILDEQTIEITELPVRVWTQVYKEQVLEQMLQGTDKIASTILDYKEYHTDLTVRFVVKMSAETMRKAREQGMHRFFKLQTTFPTTSMVLFDAAGCIRRFENVESILKEFYELRLEFYRRRKDYLEGMLAAESLRLDNQARFIVEKIDKVIYIENIPKKDIIKLLLERKYDSDPVKAWKKIQAKLQSSGDDKSDAEEGDEDSKGPDFNYILCMQLWCLTRERKDELLKQKQQKADELYHLRKKSPTDLWRDDLDAFIEELNKVEMQEKEDELLSLSHPSGKPAKGKGSKKGLVMESKPSPKGVRVVPSTEALRSKIEAVKVAAGRKKKKTEDAMVEIDGDKLLSESLERNNSENSKPQKAKKAAKPREKKEKNSPKKRGGRKGNKKNLCSDEDSDGDDISMELSGDDSDEDFGKEDSSYENLAVHKNPRKKVINSFDEDDEDNQCGDGKQEIHDDGEDRIESDDSDFKPSPPKLGKPAKAKQTTEKKKVVAKKPTEKKPKESGKPKATKTGGSKVTKAASKKKVIISDEEHDSQNKVDDDDSGEEEVHVPLRERLARKNKQVIYNYGEDSEED